MKEQNGNQRKADPSKLKKNKQKSSHQNIISFAKTRREILILASAAR